MKRKNCWEVKKCGRQPGGENVGEQEVCPAAMPSEYDGKNRGEYGGRFCWAIAGTFCNGELQGTYAKKLLNCIQCELFKQVEDEESRDFTRSPQDAKNKA